MNILGIDPGLSGGIAIISDSGRVVFFTKMPTVESKDSKGKKSRRIDIVAIAAIIAKFEPEHVFLEKAQAMPKNGAVSMFNYGTGYGMILGLSLALSELMDTNLVRPQEWQKFLYAGFVFPDSACPKEKALHRFADLWPELVEQNVSHDGIVDAILIAEYGRRILNLN